MNNPALPHGLDRGLPFRRLSTLRKRAEKKGPRFKLRNLLKSLDSDERIQGNPRESNAPERDLRSETATSQENPNGSTGPMSRPAAEKEPNRLHPNESALGAGIRYPHGRDGAFLVRSLIPS